MSDAPIKNPKPVAAKSNDGLAAGGALLTGGALLLVVGLVSVCVLGIIAAIAIPAFIGYVRQAKTAEAHSNLGTLAIQVENYCRDNGQLPRHAGPVPLTVPEAGKVMAYADFEADPGFRDLGFAPADPVYFRYQVISVPDSVIIRAEGDLDGDGFTSLFERTCSRATCGCGPFLIENETE